MSENGEYTKISDHMIGVNEVVEKDAVDDWKRQLHGLSSTALVEEFNSAFMWTDAGRTLDSGGVDHLDLTENEQHRVFLALELIKAEMTKRVDAELSAKNKTRAQLLNDYWGQGKIDNEERSAILNYGQAENAPRELLNYIIVSELGREEEQANQKSKETTYHAKLIKSVTRMAASVVGGLSVIAALGMATTPPVDPRMARQSVDTPEKSPSPAPTVIPTEVFTITSTPTRTPEPTSAPSPTGTPEPTPHAITAEQYLIQTATALPPSERNTLVHSEVFSKEQIHEIKRSSYQVFIDNGGCSTTVIDRDHENITLLLARHCFVFSMNKDFYIRENPTVLLINPETGEQTNIQVDVDGIIYKPGRYARDVALIVGKLANPKFIAPPFPKSRILSDYAFSPGQDTLVTGYPAILNQAGPSQIRFLTGEGKFTKNQDVAELGAPAKEMQSFMFEQTQEIYTPMGPGASGGSDYVVIDGKTYIVGVNSYTNVALIKYDGTILDPIHAGISNIPAEYLNQAEAKMKALKK